MASSSQASDGHGGALVRAEAARIDARIVRDRMPAEALLAASTIVAERDRPLLWALLYGSLRWHHRLQWQVGELLTRPLAAQDAELAALLRVGLLQLQAMRIPPHAAVSATVEASRLLRLGHARGLVNAVLRRFLRERDALLGRGALVEEAHFSHPAWLIAAIRGDWPEEWRGLLAANNAPPPMWLRVNARVADRARYLARLREDGIEADATSSGASSILLTEPRPAKSLPGYESGEVSIQDGAAQLAAGFMALDAGLRVLDACAAPGGKTAHLLESCPELGAVVALDRDAERLESVHENLKRLGLKAELKHADALAPRDWWDGRPFERILLDAPCSALGVIRRHPDIKILRTPDDIDRSVDLQARLLDALWPLLASGGRLLYATCTVLRRENAAQIERFLARTPDAALTGPGQQGHLQIVPGEADMDGFYYACLDKKPQQ
jgi:16S rRNA (cytosine967-C5)-methyltransferase